MVAPPITPMCNIETAEIIEKFPAGTAREVTQTIDTMLEKRLDGILDVVTFDGTNGLSLEEKRHMLKKVIGL